MYQRLRNLKDIWRDMGFSWLHQNNLVYVTCWEDPRLDRVALNLQAEDTMLAITSAGCNVLEYALDGPKKIYAVDVNPKQNALLELKIAAIRELDFETFFQMFGCGKLAGFGEIYTQKLRSHLSLASREYWDKYGTKFFAGNRSFYFRGTTGNFARAISYYIDRILKIRPSFDAILRAETIEEQKEIYDRDLVPVFWKDYISSFMNSDIALSMLGVPRQQRLQMERYLEGGIVEFVQQSCENVFTKLPLKDNYFWRVFLNGEYSLDCCPKYLEEDNFNALKSGLGDRISVHTNSITGFLKNCQDRISRFVLLDHMDWLSHYRYEELQEEWQAILNQSQDKTRILFRSGAFKVEYVDPIEVIYQGASRRVGELLTYQTELAQQLHSKDRVQTYGSFYIADLS